MQVIIAKMKEMKIYTLKEKYIDLVLELCYFK